MVSGVGWILVENRKESSEKKVRQSGWWKIGGVTGREKRKFETRQFFVVLIFGRIERPGDETGTGSGDGSRLDRAWTGRQANGTIAVIANCPR